MKLKGYNKYSYQKKLVIEIEIKVGYDEIDNWITKEKRKHNKINYKMGHEWSDALVKSHHTNYKWVYIRIIRPENINLQTFHIFLKKCHKLRNM